FPKSPAGCSADYARVDRDYASSWSIKCGLEEKPALVGSDVFVGRIKPFSQSQHGMVCGTEVDRIDIFHAFIADLAFTRGQHQPLAVARKVRLELPVRMLRKRIDFRVNCLIRTESMIIDGITE